MFAPQGPLNMFKPLKTSNKKTPSIFKNHIKDMLRIASQSYIEKQGKGEASLHYEVLGNELFEAFNASELELKRKSETKKHEQEITAARQARLRVINQVQGLVPPMPIPTQPVQATNIATNPNHPVQQPQDNLQTPQAQQTPQPTNNTNGNTPRVVTVSAARPPQRRRINPPTGTRNPPARNSVLFFENNNITEEFRHQNDVRVAHNDAPANRHRDMIDQIDQGNTMTQRAMSELSRVLN